MRQNCLLYAVVLFLHHGVAKTPYKRHQMGKNASNTKYQINTSKHFNNPISRGDTCYSLRRNTTNGITQAIDNVERLENLVSKTTFSDFFPNLFNWIHFRSIWRNEGEGVQFQTTQVFNKSAIFIIRIKKVQIGLALCFPETQKRFFKYIFVYVRIAYSFHNLDKLYVSPKQHHLHGVLVPPSWTSCTIKKSPFVKDNFITQIAIASCNNF